MTNQDRQPFAAIMLALAETYETTVSDARMEIYFSALGDLPLDAIRDAARVHAQTQKFFPRPVELRQAIEGSAEDRAELAWVQLLGEVRRVGRYDHFNSETGQVEPPRPQFFDRAAERAALSLYGNWTALCDQLPNDGAGLHAAAKEFKALYQAYARRTERQDALPPSKEEAAQVLHNLGAQLRKRGLPAPGLEPKPTGDAA